MRNTKTSTLTVTLPNKIESIRRIVRAITVVTKEVWLVLQSGSLLCSALWISKSLLSKRIPAIQIFRLSNLIHFPLFKLLSISHVHSWYADLSLRLWGPWVFDVIECLDNFLCLSLSSQTSPFRKHSVLFFGVGLPWTVCAFVSLTRDNIIEQYINTFIATPWPNVIETVSYCCFEKFRIKRYPNCPSLDYPLDLTKSTNHKLRKRKWTYNKENSKFRWPLRKHAIKPVFLWLVLFDPLVKNMSDANHLSGPLRKQKLTSTGSKGHCLWFVIDGFRSVLWVSVF